MIQELNSELAKEKILKYDCRDQKLVLLKKKKGKIYQQFLWPLFGLSVLFIWGTLITNDYIYPIFQHTYGGWVFLGSIAFFFLSIWIVNYLYYKCLAIENQMDEQVLNSCGFQIELGRPKRTRKQIDQALFEIRKSIVAQRLDTSNKPLYFLTLIGLKQELGHKGVVRSIVHRDPILAIVISALISLIIPQFTNETPMCVHFIFVGFTLAYWYYAIIRCKLKESKYVVLVNVVNDLIDK